MVTHLNSRTSLYMYLFGLRRQLASGFPLHLATLEAASRRSTTLEIPGTMAVSSAAATGGSCGLARSAPLEPSKLSVTGSLRCPTIRGLGADKGRIFALPRRRLVPVVEAMKQNQTSSSFDELLEKSDKPVLVDFYATWCGPCQYMVPVLDQVATILQNKIEIVKIDTEKEQTIANKYRIEALPTFIIFRDGKPCDRFEGAMPTTQFIDRIKSALNIP